MKNGTNILDENAQDAAAEETEEDLVGDSVVDDSVVWKSIGRFVSVSDVRQLEG